MLLLLLLFEGVVVVGAFFCDYAVVAVAVVAVVAF